MDYCLLRNAIIIAALHSVEAAASRQKQALIYESDELLNDLAA